MEARWSERTRPGVEVWGGVDASRFRRSDVFKRSLVRIKPPLSQHRLNAACGDYSGMPKHAETIQQKSVETGLC